VHRHFITCLAVALLGGLGASATAGELGATSRGTVSISITVPPHVTIEAASLRNEERSAPDAFCIASNGVTRFHVEVARPAGAKGDAFASAVSWPMCGGSGPQDQVTANAAELNQSGAGAREDVTLLVVPE
jgi:hypothetical protein